MSEPERMDPVKVASEIIPAEVREVHLPDTVPEAWQASPLALMDEQAFEKRLALMGKYMERVRRIQQSAMTVDVDYGKIPGTKKDTLLKPGAEMWNSQRNLVPSFTAERIPHPMGEGPEIHYIVKCSLHQGSTEGPVVGSGDGSCNSWEKKYRYRNEERSCPECGSKAIIKGKAEYGGGWLCWKKRDGCGAKFGDSDPAITEQQVGQVENPDIWDLDNTILKIAEKRAYVGATLLAHALSGVFTQDVGDDQEEPPTPESGSPVNVPPGASSKTSGPREASENEKMELWQEFQKRAEALGVTDADFTRQAFIQLQAPFREPGEPFLARDILKLHDAILAWDPAGAPDDEGEPF